LKYILVIMVLLSGHFLSSQKTPTEQAQPIVEEGKLLYRSEMASWYGTDLFLAKYSQRENIGGYFSYTHDDVSKCIFFSKSATPKVIGTIVFDKTYDTATAEIILTERAFSPVENELYIIRKKALEEINADRSLFKTFENTNLNLIPLINGNQKKVYVLTGPQQSGVVIFGNDYLLTFDENNALLLKKQLHKNIIPMYYGEQQKEGQTIEGGFHNHSQETGDFITATDICTLMLYAKFAKWKSYNVVSQNYVSLWNCETNELLVMTNKALERIEKHQQKKKKEKANKTEK